MTKGLIGAEINRAQHVIGYDDHEAWDKDTRAYGDALNAHPDWSYPCNVQLPSGLWVSATGDSQQQSMDPNRRVGYGHTEQEAVNNRMGKDNLDFSYTLYDKSRLPNGPAPVADHVAEHMADRRREREARGYRTEVGDVARKDDEEKARYDLLPAMPVDEVVRVFTFGAKKYSDYNYRNLEYSRVYAAAQRHMTAWRMGEETDEETGISHLAHACCCMLMLRDMQDKGDDPQRKDDR